MFFKIDYRMFVLTALLLCSALFVSCSDDDDDSPVSPGKESGSIRIGAFFDFAEDGTVHGESTLAALEAAEADIKAYFEENGIDSTVEFVAKDTENDAGYMLDAYNEMLEDGITVMFTPITSADLGFMKSFADIDGTILISQTSTSTTLSVDDSVIRLLPDDAVQGNILAKAIADDEKTHLIILHRYDIWGIYLCEALASSFTSGGGTVEATLDYMSMAPEMNMEDVLAELAETVTGLLENNDADKIAVFFACFEEGIDYLSEATNYPDLAKVNWYSADGLAKNSDLISNSTAAEFAATVGLSSSIFGEPQSSDYSDLQERIAKVTGTTPYSPAMMLYDGAWIAARAALDTDMSDTDAYVSAFIETAESYEGLFGKAKMNEYGDRANGSFDFWKVTGSDGSYSWEKNSNYIIGE